MEGELPIKKTPTSNPFSKTFLLKKKLTKTFPRSKQLSIFVTLTTRGFQI